MGKAIVRRYIEMWETGDAAVADAILTDTYRDHAHPEWPPGPAALKGNLRDFHAAFSEIGIEVGHMFGEGDLVAVTFRLQATHSGRFGPFPPTGRRVVYAGMDVARLAGDRIAELWSCADTADWLRQLGASIILPGGEPAAEPPAH